MIHFQKCWGKVTAQHVQVELVRVSWLLHELVRQLWKAKNPERSKSNACSRPPVLSEWRWDNFEKCIAFEGCCYLGYHFLSLYTILEFSLAWKRVDLAMEEWRTSKKKEVKWKALRCNAGLVQSCEEDSLQTLSMLKYYWLIKQRNKLYSFCQFWTVRKHLKMINGPQSWNTSRMDFCVNRS